MRFLSFLATANGTYYTPAVLYNAAFFFHMQLFTVQHSAHCERNEKPCTLIAELCTGSAAQTPVHTAATPLHTHYR
eukprot:284603-Pelagomonas_calceolata.AAC.2